MILRKFTFIFTAIISIGLINSCSDSENKETKIKTVELNLADKGIPVKINVPENYKIKDGMFMGEFAGVTMYNYEISKGDFAIDVIMDDSDEIRTAAELVSEAKETAKTEEGFQEFILEESNGYIYKVDFEDYEDYMFYYILIKDRRAIEFTEGLKLFSEYTEEDIRFAYDCAKSAK